MQAHPPSIVLVLETPRTLPRFAALVSQRWPGQRVYGVLTMTFGLYEFRYPRGLQVANFPYIAEPAWKPRRIESGQSSRVIEFVEGQTRHVALDPVQIIEQASTIWFACDPDATGANAYQVLITEVLGVDAAQVERPAVLLHTLSPAALMAAFDAPCTTADPRFTALVARGEAKRFFDYNYNVNALFVFSEALRAVGVDTQGYSLSKYSLQLLYFLRDRGPLEPAQIIRCMADWAGTGRYAVQALGSPVSQWPIIEGLETVDLLESAKGGLSVSVRGHALLARLHPDCQDADLPARLALWQSQWPESKPHMVRYLRTFFGKQLRYRQLV